MDLRPREPNLPLLIFLLVAAACVAPTEGSDAPSGTSSAGPRVLGVIAHPDDETAFAATAWTLTHRLGGVLDLVVITNGEGGFKYSTLGEEVYGLELTREAVGRAELPAIRREEMKAACELLGVRELVFLSETDHRYTRDAGEVLGEEARVWDLARVRRELAIRLERGDYDAAFCLLPTEATHGHHKAASILLLEAVAALAPAARPVVLGSTVEDADERAEFPADGLHAWPVTRLADPGERHVFDRERRFGHRAALDFGIVVDWVIAEHKSQGTLAMMAGEGAREVFFRFEVGPPDGRARADELFRALGGVEFPVPDYGASAGTNASR